MEFTNLLGINLGISTNVAKYDFNFSSEVINKNILRLVNQMWKLIPMREHNENWEKQLNTVILEIAGLNEIFGPDPLFLQLLSKLEGLCVKTDIEFSLYRKTVFESISILQELKNGLSI